MSTSGRKESCRFVADAQHVEKLMGVREKIASAQTPQHRTSDTRGEAAEG